MYLVCPTLYDRVELTACRMSELGVVLILENRKFLCGICRYVHQRTGDSLVVVVHTLDHKIVVHRTLAAHRRSGALPDTTVARNAGAKQCQVERSQHQVAARGGLDERQLHNLIGLERGLQLGRRRVDRARRFDNGNFLTHALHLHRNVRCSGLIKFDCDIFQNAHAESACHDGDVVITDGNVVKPVKAVHASLRCSLDASGRIRDFDCRIGHCGSARINNCSG